MRVLVAGASGVIGRQLLPLLSLAGHEVVAVSRRSQRGSDPSVTSVSADALDPRAMAGVVDEHRPDAVVHVLTQVPDEVSPRTITRDFAQTNRLRTEGLQNLVDASLSLGVGRLVVQGLAWAYEPESDGDSGPATEDVPLWFDPPRQWVTSRDALRQLEQLTAENDGLVLRFGHLYGPGTAFGADGATTRQVREGRLPVIGGGTATFSFTHTRDAALAVVAALERPTSGALNVVDDDPVQVSQWLPVMARIVGGPQPRSVPAFAARMVAGSWGVAFFTRLRGADNSRAKSQLGWTPGYGSWRDGMAAELG